MPAFIVQSRKYKVHRCLISHYWQDSTLLLFITTYYEKLTVLSHRTYLQHNSTPHKTQTPCYHPSFSGMPAFIAKSTKYIDALFPTIGKTLLYYYLLLFITTYYDHLTTL